MACGIPRNVMSRGMRRWGIFTVEHTDALMKAWSLLAYMSDTENSLAVIVWEQKKDGKVYYFRKKQARDYIDKLAEIFYGGGYGLMLDDETKKMLFEYRSILYGVLLREKGDDEKVRLENAEMVRRMKVIYEGMNKKLREDIRLLKKGELDGCFIC